MGRATSASVIGGRSVAHDAILICCNELLENLRNGARIMHGFVRILVADGVYDCAEFSATFVLGRVLNIREDDKGDGILIYRDAIRVEAADALALNCSTFATTFCWELNVVLRMFCNWSWIFNVAGQLAPLMLALISLKSW